MNEYKFSYQEEYDDLFIYEEGKTSSGAVEFGNLVIDFDEKGDLVALQVTNASEFFSKFLSEAINMNKIKSIELETKNYRNIEGINFKVSTDEDTYSSNILLPKIQEKSPALSY